MTGGFQAAVGSGKTTTAGMLTTRVVPTSGRAFVAGVDVAALGMTLRRVALVRLSLVCAAADAGAGWHGGPAAWRGRCRSRARPAAAALAAAPTVVVFPACG
jgi:hypothetical protein